MAGTDEVKSFFGRREAIRRLGRFHR